MSADKHRNLAIRTGYLRAASSGLGLNNKWMRKLTPFLKGMIRDGEIVLRREGAGGSKNVTVAHITEIGTARLAATLKRFGPDFGPISSIDRVEPVSLPKNVRRKNKMSPEDRRAAAKALAAKRVLLQASVQRSLNAIRDRLRQDRDPERISNHG